METYLSNRFNDIVYNPETSILYHIHKPDTAEMVEEDFKSMLIKWRETVLKVQPQSVLIDALEMNFPMSPELQVWITDEVTVPIFTRTQLQKMCFVMPEEFVSKLSLDQYRDASDKVVEDKSINYVSTRDMAEEWLR